MNIGIVIKEVRKQKGLTQLQTRKRIGIAAAIIAGMFVLVEILVLIGVL